MITKDFIEEDLHNFTENINDLFLILADFQEASKLKSKFNVKEL